MCLKLHPHYKNNTVKWVPFPSNFVYINVRNSIKRFSYLHVVFKFHFANIGKLEMCSEKLCKHSYDIIWFYQPFSLFISGNYSVAGFELTLRRKVSHYIITYYLPSGMFVIVSWISFLVPADIVPGRMTLLVTVFLVLVNIFNTITTNIPKAEGTIIRSMKL